MECTHRPGWLLSLSAFLLGIAILLGAVAAHALKKTLDANLMHTFEVGVHYQQVQSLGLMLIGLFLYFRPLFWERIKFPLCLHLLSIVLFSGDCYLYAITQIKCFVYLIPVGGFMMIIAWIWTALLWGQESGSKAAN